MSKPSRIAQRIAYRQDGFILVTSLIFLVVLTLLAVSAIDSSTLQERMAANQREKARALDAADSALRHVETLLGSHGFQACNPAVRPSANGSTTNPGCNGNAATLTVVAARTNDDSASGRYLSDAFWSQPGVSTYKLPEDPNDSDLTVQYVVEYVRQNADDLNPSSAGTSVLFRITARTQGRSPASRAVVQSIYQVTI